MHRLYQWLYERASFYRSDTSSHGTTRRVRTEVTVQREGMTMLISGAGTVLDVCPFCGSHLDAASRSPVLASERERRQG
jgi:hypothetical protein